MKIYEITFPLRLQENTQRDMANTLTTGTGMLQRYKYKTTIFSRANIVNTNIIPKNIYLVTILDLPKQVITDIYKHIRVFIFSNIFYSIKHQTLIQHKEARSDWSITHPHKDTSISDQLLRNITTHAQHNKLANHFVGI